MSVAGVAAGPLVDLFGTVMAMQDAAMDRTQNRELADETAFQMENHHRALEFKSVILFFNEIRFQIQTNSKKETLLLDRELADETALQLDTHHKVEIDQNRELADETADQLERYDI